MSKPFVLKKVGHVAQIGTILNAIRVNENVSQEILAQEMKMRQSQISMIENDRKTPTLTTLMKFLEPLGYRIVIEKAD